MGGLAAAVALRRVGIDVAVYEQADLEPHKRCPGLACWRGALAH